MTDLRDLEHDSLAEAPDVIGRTPELGPEPTDRQLDHEEMREELREKRERQAAKPETRDEMLKRRYGIREERPSAAAGGDEWLRADNDELWTPIAR